MKPSDQARFDSLHQEHLNVLRLQGLAPPTAGKLMKQIKFGPAQEKLQIHVDADLAFYKESLIKYKPYPTGLSSELTLCVIVSWRD